MAIHEFLYVTFHGMQAAFNAFCQIICSKTFYLIEKYCVYLEQTPKKVDACQYLITTSVILNNYEKLWDS